MTVTNDAAMANSHRSDHLDANHSSINRFEDLLQVPEVVVSTDDVAPLVDAPKRSWSASRAFNLLRSESRENPESAPASRRTLSSFDGVFIPVALSMFSTVLFLRLGFVVGQAGLLEAILQFLLAYVILSLTVLSICAISTNGAVEGGGAYYMISRALGPEFGGSIGVLFFVANIFSCALYIAGFVEGLIDNFGPGGHSVPDVLPSGGHWWPYLYCSCVLLFCLLVCLIGGAMFARTSTFILFIVIVCTLSVIISTFVKAAFCVPIPHSNKYVVRTNDTNGTDTTCGNYTGLSGETFTDNLLSQYGVDYATGKIMTFAGVFAVLFSSVTGIMNGANMSGELKDPSRDIPRGTLGAVAFTFCTYLILALLVSLSSTRELLLNNYIFMQPTNLWPPFVIIGIFAATLSAALGNLIGASRVLEALAKDDLFWVLLKPAKITTKGGNPIIAVLISWVLVQSVMLIGSLNAIAPIASIFFLLSYASTNLACLALELASAPNFRPTFRFFSWHTCLLGMIGSIVMTFLINAIYASVAIIVCMILVIVLHLRSLPASWGSISQALIFHQVRKYLLLLDSRKDHVKFWRPQMLLLISNPRSCCDLITFINDLKKSGLFVIGHIKLGDFDEREADPCMTDYPFWLNLVDKLKIKAFIELTMASSIREGVHHLIRVSGLGGMKPNTICLGFYDSAAQRDTLLTRKINSPRRVRFYTSAATDEDETVFDVFPQLRIGERDRLMTPLEYVQIVADSLKMCKNVCLFRHFHNLDKNLIVKSKGPKYIDVWPLNFFNPESANYFDNTCLFLLQLSCILTMVPGWRKSTKLRIFLCVDTQKSEADRKQKKLQQLLIQLRILGDIKVVSWEHLVAAAGSPSTPDSEITNQPQHSVDVTDEYIRGVNSLIKSHCENTAVTFCYLPLPDTKPTPEQASEYLHHLDLMTSELPPTVLVHGLYTVTSTTL